MLSKILNVFNKIGRQEKFPPINPCKKRLIDFAFRNLTPAPRSFADLGGIWNVDGAYTFYALGQYTVHRAFLADTHFTKASLEYCQKYKNLATIKANFGDAETLKKIGRVDALFLFDVLLHQVKPDWDEILEMTSGITNCFIIYNQQWIQSDRSVRLLDLGIEEYFKNIPHSRKERLYRDLLEKMNEIHPRHLRPWRDIHNIWQWGITDHDLLKKMEALGFRLKHTQNDGRAFSLTNFEHHGFVFQKIP